jgi:hypothetical protein
MSRPDLNALEPFPSEHRVTLAMWEEGYGIRFLESERALLISPRDLLTPIDRQRAYLLRLALRPEQCPACKYILCQRSAWAGGDFDPGTAPDGPGYTCPACKAALEHRQGLIITEHWMDLAPGQTVEVR